MITINEITMAVDQSMRRFGTTDVQLSLSVSDRTPFSDRGWDPFDRYAYRAKLFGFGRDGTPNKQEATFIAKFGLVVNVRELICRHLPRFRCDFETRTRVLEVQRFTSAGGDTGEDNIVMLGQTSITVAIDDLDVDNEPDLRIRFRGQDIVIPRPKSDILFCTVDIIDLEDNDAVVASGESNTFEDFFGRTEPRTGHGDNSEEPVRPPTIP